LIGKIVRRLAAQVNIAVQRCARVKFGSLQTRSTDGIDRLVGRW
jgi:16S rRNA U516 pseudouridylate synthase RsuA-like enzyme